MEDNKTIFNYIGHLFATYGIIVLIFIFLGITIGADASNYSSLFQLGNQGLSFTVLLQLLLLAIIISISQIIFLTDKLIKQMSLLIRIILFYGLIVLTIIVFVIVFQWFPAQNINAWIGFVISFTICTTLSVIINRLKEQTDNKKMEQALNQLKKRK